MKYAVLSTTLLLESGIFEYNEITKEQAQTWVDTHSPENFSGHETVKVLGLEPDKTRKVCEGYDKALCLSAKSRLEFGKEYTIEEIEEIGVIYALITKIFVNYDEMKDHFEGRS